jgi:hypothetical protein
MLPGYAPFCRRATRLEQLPLLVVFGMIFLIGPAQWRVLLVCLGERSSPKQTNISSEVRNSNLIQTGRLIRRPVAIGGNQRAPWDSR